MTILEAFRNRGLLVPEMNRPIYRITYGRSKYDRRTVEFETTGWKMAKEELQEQWDRYADERHIRRDEVLEIHCVADKGFIQRGGKAR